MKPINLNKETCNPISSNCVIWQGPDIPCIKLCKGDTVSDVVFKLATELCEILDTLDVQNYDISCFNINACAPQNFQQLIQLIIDKICELQDVTPSPVPGDGGCPDCLVTVASCFEDTFPSGNAQLIDYAQEIASRICSITLQVTALQTAVSILDGKVAVLESYFPLPTPAEVEIIPAVCLGIGSADTPVSIVVSALQALFCSLLNVTGDDIELYNAIISQCVTDADPRKDGGGPMSSIPGWNTSPVTTIAQSITNLWLSVCDLRALVLPTVAVTDTQTINLSITAGPSYSISGAVVDTGWVDLNGFNYYTGGMASSKPQCRRIGNVIHFRGQVIIPLSSTADNMTLVPLTASSLYNSQAVPYVFGGVDGTYGNGVQIDSNGGIYFNQNNNCIPISVWNAGLDGEYGLGWIIATRQIDVNINAGTALNAALNVGLTSSGALIVAVVKDVEISTTRSTAALGASPLRFITSNVELGAEIPSYVSLDSNIHNASSAAEIGTGYISGTTFTQVTGTFIAGQKLIGPGVADDTFILSETAPGVFDVNISQVVGSAPSPVTLRAMFPITYSTQLQTAAGSPSPLTNGLTWPFSCDASNEKQIGGFSFNIDGLMAFIAP